MAQFSIHSQLLWIQWNGKWCSFLFLKMTMQTINWHLIWFDFTVFNPYTSPWYWHTIISVVAHINRYTMEMAKNGINCIAVVGCIQYWSQILCHNCSSTIELCLFWRIVSTLIWLKQIGWVMIDHWFLYRIKQLFRTADLMYSIPLHRATIYIFGIFTGYAMRMYKNVRLSKVSQIHNCSEHTVRLLRKQKQCF